MSNSRLEKFIYAICGMDVDDLPTPLSRIETLWNCLITGEMPDFEPLSRNEKYLMAMLNDDVDGLPKPTSRSEKLLYKIATGETDLSDVPGYLSRYEELLKQLIESGGIGGTDFEYVLYTLNDSFSTLYSTAEAPVKSAILKGNTLVNVRKTISMIASDIPEIRLDTSLMKANTKYSVFVTGVPNDRKWAIVPYVSYTNNQNATFVTSENLETQLKFYISLGNVMTKEEIERVNITIVEGDVPLEMHFEGMQSVKMPVLTTTGKNLWDDNWAKGLTQTSGNVLTGGTYDGFRYNNNLISVDGISTIYLKHFCPQEGVPQSFRVGQYGKDKEWLNKPLTVVTDGIFNIPSDCKYIRVHVDLRYNGTSNNTSDSIPTMMVVSTSKITDYEPFKTNILTTTSKNLFDMNRPYDVITDSQATVVQDTNQITVSSSESGIYVNANFILDKDFFAGKTVTGSCLYESDEKDIGTVQISYQDANGEYHYQWIKTPKTFTFPNSFIGDVMLSISANNTGTPQSNTVTVKNIQLELGSTATSYEPYSEGVTLRGIGDVKDTLDGNTGELTQRIGEMKITDEMIDKFTIYGNFINNFNSIFSGLPERKIETFGTISPISMLSDKMITKAWSGGTMVENVVYFSQYKSGDMRVYHSPDWTLDEFKEWFRENKPTIQYELATPIIKTVDLSITDQNGQPTKLSTFNDITHVSIEAEDLLPTVDLEVATKIEETLSTLPTLMNDISETQQLLSESIDDQAEDINEVSTAMTEIHNDIL